MTQLGQTITFLSHMQRGLARHRASDGTVAAELTLEAGSRSAVVSQSLQLGGPEHVTGLSSTQVIRRVPSADSADFEPNFFPCVEFALPDLPWMFSASGTAADDRLDPWIALIVVPRGAGVHLSDPPPSGGLGVLSLSSLFDIEHDLPDLSEAWAWAHVQIDADVADTDVADLFASSPELFRSRLVCPKRLKPLTDYVACVVPITRGGVHSGLGIELDERPHDAAWTGRETTLRLPVYHSWSFRTAQRGDFEALVRRLEPIELEAGTVPLDLSAPGDPRLPQTRGASVTFKGALVGTEAPSKPWNTEHRQDWLAGMAQILETHRPGASVDKPDYNALVDDPVVAPPLWGGRKINKVAAPDAPVPGKASDWFSTLNYHPAHRAAAGLGAECIRQNQEALMAEAWRQLDELREVNRTLNHTRLACETTQALRHGKIDAIPASEAVLLSGSAKARMGGRFRDLQVELEAEIAPQGVFSTAMSRLVRAQGQLGKKISISDPPAAATLTFFAEDPDTAVSFADFVEPAQMANTDFTAALAPPGLSQEEEERVFDYLQADVTEFRLGGSAFSAVAAASQDLQAVTRRVHSPMFQGTTPKRRAVRRQGGTVRRVTPIEARQKRSLNTPLKSAASDRPVLSTVFDPVPVLRARLDQKLTMPAHVIPDVGLPRPVLVSPRFDISGYTMLRAISPDAVMPGVQSVPMNKVGLAEVNTKFVESWLTGVNAELAREFLWREYPGRLDGTYIRRFWDTPGGIDDIGPISRWSNALGAHQTGLGTDGTLVLLVKGEVLARFPGLRIYASPAMWDDRLFRKEVPEAHKLYKFPMFGGWLDPKTAFFAFDLDLTKAKGSLELMGPDPGWFFVFEQPPEGVQFGLDVATEESPEKPDYWADLDWSHVLDDPLGMTGPTHVSLNRDLGVERLPYDLDMFTETWGRSASAQARITLQRPARVLMHASGMLS